MINYTDPYDYMDEWEGQCADPTVFVAERESELLGPNGEPLVIKTGPIGFDLRSKNVEKSS